MRRTILNEFNAFSKYIVKKRHKPAEFLISSLQAFIVSKYEAKVVKMGIKSTDLVNELTFILGSMFYPKIMK
jgi:hypothetical protein